MVAEIVILVRIAVESSLINQEYCVVLGYVDTPVCPI